MKLKELLTDFLKPTDKFKDSGTFELIVIVIRELIKGIPLIIGTLIYLWLCFKFAEYLAYRIFDYEEALDNDVSIGVYLFKIFITIMITLLIFSLNHIRNKDRVEDED